MHAKVLTTSGCSSLLLCTYTKHRPLRRDKLNSTRESKQNPGLALSLQKPNTFSVLTHLFLFPLSQRTLLVLIIIFYAKINKTTPRRRMLSLHKLDTSLTQLDRMIAWADNAEDSVSALEAGELGPGLPMSEIGLSKFVFFASSDERDRLGKVLLVWLP